MKRYIYIIIGIIVAAVIAILVLFLIKSRTAASPTITGSGTSTSGSLPNVATQGSGSAPTSSVSTLGLLGTTSGASTTPTGQTTVQNFGVLSNLPILDYFVNAQNTVTGIQPTGAIIAISNGQTTTINSSTINNIISASFSYDGKKIVVSYGDPSNPQAGVYDVATNAWTPLAQGLFSPQWSPASNYQIAYLAASSAGTMALKTINAANLKTAPVTLLALNANDLELSWPTANEFVLSDKPTDQSVGSMWAFNASTKTLTALVYGAAGVEGAWSHDAAIPYGLVFFDNPAGQGTTLQLQAISGNLPTQPLSIATLPSKCVFNAELTAGTSADPTSTISVATSTPYLALYCGIPRSSSGFSSAHLPDDYNTMALFTADDVYKINTMTGAEQVLWSDATQNIDISDIKFFNNALFFVNRYDQKLYGLTLSM